METNKQQTALNTPINPKLSNNNSPSKKFDKMYSLNTPTNLQSFTQLSQEKLGSGKIEEDNTIIQGNMK